MLFSIFLIAALLSGAFAQDNTTDYIVDLGYAKYRGLPNDSYPKYAPNSVVSHPKNFIR